MEPEIPYLAAGAISIAGGVIREKGWPLNLSRSVVSTIILVIAASALGSTALAPVVRAVGLLLVVVALIAAVNATRGNSHA